MRSNQARLKRLEQKHPVVCANIPAVPVKIYDGGKSYRHQSDPVRPLVERNIPTCSECGEMHPPNVIVVKEIITLPDDEPLPADDSALREEDERTGLPVMHRETAAEKAAPEPEPIPDVAPVPPAAQSPVEADVLPASTPDAPAADAPRAGGLLDLFKRSLED
jgi:hypothetical protein